MGVAVGGQKGVSLTTNLQKKLRGRLVRAVHACQAASIYIYIYYIYLYQ